MDNLKSPTQASHGLTNIDSQIQRNTAQLWFNQDKGSFYIVDAKGNSQKCDSGGQQPAKFNPLLTGYANFNKRNEFEIKSQNDKKAENKELVIIPNKSLKFLKESPRNLYLPQLNKFEGYVQFRCPLARKSMIVEDGGKNLSGNDDLLEQMSNQKKSQKKQQVKVKAANLKGAFVRTLPKINEQGKIQENSIQDYNEESKFSKQQQFPILDRKNISALYQSYKNSQKSSRTTEYFQQQRKSQYADKQQTKVLDEYAKFLKSSIKKPHHHVSQGVLHDDDQISNVEIIRKSAISLHKDNTVEAQPKKKILELSLKILSQQQKESELKEPPSPHKIFGQHKRHEAKLLRESADFTNSNFPVENSISLIHKSQSVFGTFGNGSQLKTSSQQTFQMTTIQPSNQQSVSSPASMLASLRYKSYSDLKCEHSATQAIPQYTQLKNKDKELISGFLTVSPRQEFEKEIQQSRNLFIESEVDHDISGSPFVIEHQDQSSNQFNRTQCRSISPRIKTIMDFGNPFKLAQVKFEEINAHKAKQDLKKGLQAKTSGRFNEAIESIRHGGQHWKVDKQWILKANPHADEFLKKKDEFELKRVRNKKHQKKLQAMALEQDMKIEDKKIFKKFIKYM